MLLQLPSRPSVGRSRRSLPRPVADVELRRRGSPLLCPVRAALDGRTLFAAQGGASSVGCAWEHGNREGVRRGR
jgi:hypothetical protein